MELSQFDSIFDAVAAYDKDGTVHYCNDAFAQIVGVAAHRISNKYSMNSLFENFDGKPLSPEDLDPQILSNIRVVHFSTKMIEKGIGQYCLSKLNENLSLFIMRDLSLEDQLKDKYRREMDSKDKKIEEMKSLINLLQKTRLVKEPAQLLKEFGLHVLNQFELEKAYLITPNKVVSAIYSKQKDFDDPLLPTLGSAKIPPQYVVYSAKEMAGLQIGFIPNLKKLVVVPIRAQQKQVYLLVLPIYMHQSDKDLDHETIDTLGEQMSLMLENMALEKLSIFDDLTKLYNARFFREKLDEYTANYKDLILILLDIDFFKKVNDTYGHLAGDLVLQHMGATLKELTKVKDLVVARVGGEEFAILIPNQSLDKVLAMAEELANKIRALEIKFEDKILKITSSFGVSTWHPSKMAVREFYKTADEALYKSKKDGRDRITTHKAS